MAIVTAEMFFNGTLFEEIAGPFGEASGFDYSLTNRTLRATNDTVPGAHQVWGGILALAAGTLTINLTTSLVRAGRAALDLTGLRIIGYRIESLGAASMVFSAPVTNPYNMFTSDGTAVGAGGLIQQWEPDGFGTVGASNLAILVTGTGTDTFRLGLVAGNP